MKSKRSVFWIKLANWEYWPWYIVYIPIFVYWLWCGLKTRAIFWINAANPGFEYGGIVGSSKKSILNKIPDQYVPRGFIIEPTDSSDSVLTRMDGLDLSFPVILKPDIGERGFHVELINNSRELEHHRKINNETFLLQEYLDLPLELGIFYLRIPGEENGQVTSIVVKALLKVTGDGVSSVYELMERDDRAVQQIKRIEQTGRFDLDEVLLEGQELLLEPIGNHVRGTAFLDGSDLISEELNHVINNISKQVDGFFYGRFDLRCRDVEGLRRGELKIMELNGSASEPAHIYAPGFPILKGYKILIWHWRQLYRISKLNHKKGVPYMPFSIGWKALKKSRFTR